MTKSKKKKADLVRTAVSSAGALSAGVLSGLLATFLANVGKLGWTAAVSALDVSTAGGITALATLLGISEHCNTAATATRKAMSTHSPTNVR